MFRIDDRVGTVGSDHPAAPAARPDRAMMLERVDGRFSGRQYLYVEALEERARTELGHRELGTYRVEIVIRGIRIEPHIDAEHFHEHVFEPHRGRGAGEQVIVTREQAPGGARFRARRAAFGGDTEILERDALTVEHAEQV